MSLRAAAAAVAVLALTAPAAHAGTRPLCRLVADAAGDSTGTVQRDRPEHDILSGDVATDAATVTTVVRVREVPVSGPGSPSVAYTFAWRYGAYGVQTMAVTSATGTWLDVSYGLPDSAQWTRLDTPVTGVFDAARGEVRVSFGLAALRRAVPGGGTRFTGFGLEAAELAGTVVGVEQGGPVGTLHPADRATSTRAYQFGTRTCVRAGVPAAP